MVSAVNRNQSRYTLRYLCANLGAQFDTAGEADPLIMGLTADSHRVQPGFLFAAIRGSRADGHDYIEQAVAKGAAAVLVDRPSVRAQGAAVVRVNDAREALAALSVRWIGLDEAVAKDKLRLFGVTGTNGKSTTCYLIRALLNHAGHQCANIGTIEYDLVGRRTGSRLTTPDPLELAELLAEAQKNGADRAAMEVSSHALDQRRTDGLRFAAAVFTNLTGDHQDYHGGAEAYLLAKKRLFDRLDESSLALVNGDDPATDQMVEDCHAQVVRFGLGNDAQLRGEIEEMKPAGTWLRIYHGGLVVRVHTSLVGRHNAYNVLAAFGIALAEGMVPKAIVEGIESLRTVPGRLEKVGGADCPINVFVDYAHTDDALNNVLTAARAICRRRLVVVFGCGGDRDRTKRPRMARAAADLADQVVVTSDNPRTEDPRRIIDDILAGLDGRQRRHALVELDREQAIARTIEQARPGDLVLIAGKGHEDYQIIGEERRRFDDRVVASRILERVCGARV